MPSSMPAQPTPPALPITHVIFDLDGTLVDTEPIYQAVTNAIFARFGLTLPEEVRVMMMGRTNPEAVRLMLERTPLPMTAEAFIAERDVELHEHFRTVSACSGAVRLTSHLAARGVPMAIATASLPPAFEAKRSGHAEWFDTFNTFVLGDEVPRGKPAPDLFLEAARRLGAAPEHCLVFEDAPNGVEGALAAGMHVIGVPAPGHEDRVTAAHRVLGSLDEFDPAEWGLPGYA